MEASAGEYSVDEDNQLQPEDTLIDRGVDDVLDEGYSPPERRYGRGSFGSTPESLDQLLAEEEPDPATRIYDPFDKGEQQRSDEAERETEFPQRNEGRHNSRDHSKTFGAHGLSRLHPRVPTSWRRADGREAVMGHSGRLMCCDRCTRYPSREPSARGTCDRTTSPTPSTTGSTASRRRWCSAAPATGRLWQGRIDALSPSVRASTYLAGSPR